MTGRNKNTPVLQFQTLHELHVYFSSLEYRTQIEFGKRMAKIERGYLQALAQFREQESHIDTPPGDDEQEREP